MSNNIHKRCAEIMAELGKNGEFEFWEEFKWLPKQKLEKRLKDILEDDVEEKYYLSDKMIKGFSNKSNNFNGSFEPHNKDDNHSKCLTARYNKMGRTDPYIKEPNCTPIGLLDIKGLSPCLTTQENNHLIEDYRIRKLTPRECFRLQDFDDTFKFVVSNSQLYRQAGNSISVNVSEMIFRQIELSKGKNMNKNSLF